MSYIHLDNMFKPWTHNQKGAEQTPWSLRAVSGHVHGDDFQDLVYTYLVYTSFNIDLFCELVKVVDLAGWGKSVHGTASNKREIRPILQSGFEECFLDGWVTVPIWHLVLRGLTQMHRGPDRGCQIFPFWPASPLREEVFRVLKPLAKAVMESK